MAITKAELYSLIKASFPDDEPEIIALVDDGDHYEIRLSSSKFKDLSSIDRHRLVNKALGGIVGNTLHALSLKLTPKD